MDSRNTDERSPPVTSAGMDQSEELVAEVDEPPESLKSRAFWASPTLHATWGKAVPNLQRRESLLTRQLHSETEHTDDDIALPPRTLSTQSTWSNPSMASTAELTSDDGHSVASPAVSPPLPPTQDRTALPMFDKIMDQKVKIVGQDDTATTGQQKTGNEQAVEANLGRKRCITFACKGKEEAKPTPPPTSEPTQSETVSPPKRKCMLKFACPTKPGSESKASEKAVEKTTIKRPVSPPPPVRKTSPALKHRDSDSTVTQVSPQGSRKSPAPANRAPTSEPAPEPVKRRYSNESADYSDNEATRFHEFGTSDEDAEQWVQESTCYRNRLTVSDTLKKENYIRKTCEEVEEEVLEEEEEDEEEEIEEDLAVAEGKDDDQDDIEEEDESDDGFHSDDEHGFANSDSENDDDSDFEWWKPGGVSTAATSVDHLDRLAIVNSQPAVLGSSLGSASSNHMSPQVSKRRLRRSGSKASQTPAMTINKPDDDLPDSTDFVCGTLDEDRPLEQAYFNRKKVQEAAKQGFRPQDIDPSFPTSDPEMDEEDDDDVQDDHQSESEDDMMHGDFDELHAETATRKRSSPRMRQKSTVHRSPPPPTARARSPAPTKMRATNRSPPPTRRSTARSPPPRKLFGHSPDRTKSPAPVRRMTSPPNSPIERNSTLTTPTPGLAGRPQPTHTSSLPRGGAIIGKMATSASETETTDNGVQTDIPKRGAIDIVKGLEKKRQRRKEKMSQKMAAKAMSKGEKMHRVKPGKGAERMREVGLQLQQYQGKAEHILSL